jgi:hypothetical protein
MRFITIQLIALLFILIPLSCLAASSDPCDRYPATLLVDTSSHTMWVCLDGKARSYFHVSLGRGGIKKRTEGDEKTPLGGYRLGFPRTSSKYGFFIPIVYPNDKQKSKGFSGGDVGIHGPHRELLWLGKYSTEADWTRGCIALSTDDEIMELVDWVKNENIYTVVIR